VTAYHCATCGAQFAPAPEPPARCPICEDARQYVPESGQRWLSPEELAAEHRNAIQEDGAYDGVGMEPRFAIGQRALLVPAGERFVLWECTPLLDDAAAAEIERRGGLAAIAISHPHYYTGMVEWAHRFGCPVYLHADDQEWIMRPDPAVELWEGETRDLGHGLTLIRCGGHFAGGTVLHDAARGHLLSGDIVQVIPDRGWVSFMYSYPNLIPLPEAAVRRIVDALEPYDFDAIYGAWWGTLVRADAKAIVRRSAERYVAALSGTFPTRSGSVRNRSSGSAL
jgi:glyoxylase-like metal-dependent hydrolase (beta-lactamase superfamily II)